MPSPSLPGPRPMTPTDAPPLPDDAMLRTLLTAALRDTELLAVLVADAEGIIRWANRAAARIFGYAPDALAGRPLDMLFVPRDVALRIPEAELDASSLCGHAEDDRWHMRADGSAFWSTGSTTAVRDGAGVLLGYVKILRNRTDLREQVVRLDNERDVLRSEQHAAALRLARGVHELRNPMSAILGASSVLERASSGADPTVSRMAGVVQRQVAQMARLLDELMGAGPEPVPQPVGEMRGAPVQAVLEDVVMALASDPAERGRLGLMLMPEDLEVRMDRMHLQQVFANLLSNAFKYTPRDRTVWVRVVTEGGEAVVRFEDHGIGIAPDVLAGIFDLFTRADAVQHLPGSGIGLAVVRDLVARYGGSVVAQSEGEGTGAVFTVRLPLVERQVHREASLVADARAARG